VRAVTGIDEAGRGAIVGPLVITAVTLDTKSLKELKSLGVKDSKKLTPKRREKLYEEIEKRAKDIFVVKIAPCKIDKYRRLGINLDKIEAMHVAQLIEFATNSKIYIDSLTSNPPKFKNLIFSYLTKKISRKDVVVKNYLDETNIAVGAASIIAKVERDKEIKKLEKKYGMEIGVGYSHDKRTIKFIEHFLENKKKLPDCIRKTWITYLLLKQKHTQKSLNKFLTKKEL
jgi:ribonuclease HII